MRSTYVWIGIGFLVIVILGIRFINPEDDWICTKGEWVKHGNPSQSKPVEPCQ